MISTESKILRRSPFIISIMALSFFVGRYSHHDITPGYIHQSLVASGYHLCTHVTDGDTIRVIFNGQEERVRILDIDAPEIRRTSKLREQAKRAGLSEDAMIGKGFEAKYAVESMVLGRKVNISFRNDVVERDSFGRLLAHVYIDGKNVAQRLIEMGLAEEY